MVALTMVDGRGEGGREREREEMRLLDLYSLYNIVWEFIKPETEKHRINQEIHG